MYVGNPHCSDREMPTTAKLVGILVGKGCFGKCKAY